MGRAGLSFPLVHASAEQVPLPDASFDIVFCDYGATTFTDPYRTVPEVARLLRSGGLFAFTHSSPILSITWAADAERAGDRLIADYFGMRQFEYEDSIDFNLPYGEWIALFHKSGFELEDLIETRPPADAVSTYRDEVQRDWSRRWPAECLWRMRRR
jgi:ubiquinone/menaquinone biosynthesis C-methylase UbiE